MNATAIVVMMVSLIVAIFVHELGHLLAMRDCGVSVKKMMIGIGFGVPIHSRWLKEKFGKNFVLSFGLFPLAGGVEPENYKEEERSYADVAYISGAGPLVNLLMLIFTYGIGWSVILLMRHNTSLMAWGATSLLLLSGIVIWWQRRFICRYIFPIISLLVLAQVVYLFSHSFQLVWESGNIAILGREARAVKDVSDFVNYWNLINLALGLTNLLPLYPFDGGRIATRLLGIFSGRAAAAFKTLGVVAFYGLIFFCLASDFRILMQ